MAAKEKRMATRSQIPNLRATDKSEPSIRAEFVAETLQAIAELDSGIGNTYSSKKEFLDDLEHL
jgi:hypothetical protein